MEAKLLPLNSSRFRKEEEELQGYTLLEMGKKKGKLSITIQQAGFRMRGNYRGDK